MFDNGRTRRNGRPTSSRSQNGSMRLHVDIDTTGGMQITSKNGNVTEACCTSQSKTFQETSTGNHDRSRNWSTVLDGRLGELVLHIVLSETHALPEMLQNTNTLFLEACQSRRLRGTGRLETRRQHYCRMKP